MTTIRRKKEEENKIKYGLQLAGVIRVFTKEKTIKSKGKEFDIVEAWFTVSRKNDKDEYINKSMNIFFAKDIDIPEHNSLIWVDEGNLFLTGNEGYERISLYVKSWDYVN